MFTASTVYFSAHRPVAFANDTSAIVDAALKSLEDNAFLIADDRGRLLSRGYPGETAQLEMTKLVFERAWVETLKEQRPESPEAFKSAFLHTLSSQTGPGTSQNYSFDPSSGQLTLRGPANVTYKVDSNQLADNLAAIYSLVELSRDEAREVN